MTKKAFTLTEIMIVMVIVAIMASWGLPQYTRAISRARARNAMNNLTMIHAANLIYQARHGGSNFVGANLAAINNMNGANSLNIVSGGLNYACDNGGCTADEGVGSKYSVFVVYASPIDDATPNPSCTNLGTDRICP